MAEGSGGKGVSFSDAVDARADSATPRVRSMSMGGLGTQTVDGLERYGSSTSNPASDRSSPRSRGEPTGSECDGFSLTLAQVVDSMRSDPLFFVSQLQHELMVEVRLASVSKWTPESLPQAPPSFLQPEAWLQRLQALDEDHPASSMSPRKPSRAKKRKSVESTARQVLSAVPVLSFRGGGTPLNAGSTPPTTGPTAPPSTQTASATPTNPTSGSGSISPSAPLANPSSTGASGTGTSGPSRPQRSPRSDSGHDLVVQDAPELLSPELAAQLLHSMAWTAFGYPEAEFHMFVERLCLDLLFPLLLGSSPGPLTLSGMAAHISRLRDALADPGTEAASCDELWLQMHPVVQLGLLSAMETILARDSAADLLRAASQSAEAVFRPYAARHSPDTQRKHAVRKRSHSNRSSDGAPTPTGKNGPAAVSRSNSKRGDKVLDKRLRALVKGGAGEEDTGLPLFPALLALIAFRGSLAPLVPALASLPSTSLRVLQSLLWLKEGPFVHGERLEVLRELYLRIVTVQMDAAVTLRPWDEPVLWLYHCTTLSRDVKSLASRELPPSLQPVYYRLIDGIVASLGHHVARLHMPSSNASSTGPDSTPKTVLESSHPLDPSFEGAESTNDHGSNAPVPRVLLAAKKPLGEGTEWRKPELNTVGFQAFVEAALHLWLVAPLATKYKQALLRQLEGLGRFAPFDESVLRFGLSWVRVLVPALGAYLPFRKRTVPFAPTEVAFMGSPAIEFALGEAFARLPEAAMLGGLRWLCLLLSASAPMRSVQHLLHALFRDSAVAYSHRLLMCLFAFGEEKNPSLTRADSLPSRPEKRGSAKVSAPNPISSSAGCKPSAPDSGKKLRKSKRNSTEVSSAKDVVSRAEEPQPKPSIQWVDLASLGSLPTLPPLLAANTSGSEEEDLSPLKKDLTDSSPLKKDLTDSSLKKDLTDSSPLKKDLPDSSILSPPPPIPPSISYKKKKEKEKDSKDLKDLKDMKELKELKELKEKKQKYGGGGGVPEGLEAGAFNLENVFLRRVKEAIAAQDGAYLDAVEVLCLLVEFGGKVRPMDGDMYEYVAETVLMGGLAGPQAAAVLARFTSLMKRGFLLPLAAGEPADEVYRKLARWQRLIDELQALSLRLLDGSEAFDAGREALLDWSVANAALPALLLQRLASPEVAALDREARLAGRIRRHFAANLELLLLGLNHRGTPSSVKVRCLCALGASILEDMHTLEDPSTISNHSSTPSTFNSSTPSTSNSSTTCFTNSITPQPSQTHSSSVVSTSPGIPPPTPPSESPSTVPIQITTNEESNAGPNLESTSSVGSGEVEEEDKEGEKGAKGRLGSEGIRRKRPMGGDSRLMRVTSMRTSMKAKSLSALPVHAKQRVGAGSGVSARDGGNLVVHGLLAKVKTLLVFIDHDEEPSVSSAALRTVVALAQPRAYMRFCSGASREFATTLGRVVVTHLLSVLAATRRAQVEPWLLTLGLMEWLSLPLGLLNGPEVSEALVQLVEAAYTLQSEQLDGGDGALPAASLAVRQAKNPMDRCVLRVQQLYAAMGSRGPPAHAHIEQLAAYVALEQGLSDGAPLQPYTGPELDDEEVAAHWWFAVNGRSLVAVPCDRRRRDVRVFSAQGTYRYGLHDSDRELCHAGLLPLPLASALCDSRGSASVRVLPLRVTAEQLQPFRRFVRQLARQSSRQLVKAAVLYVARGREKEEDILGASDLHSNHSKLSSNQSSGDIQKLEEFMDQVAIRRPLRQYEGYAGGLDTKGGEDGSVFWASRSSAVDVAYHVAHRILPPGMGAGEALALRRKRHVGNDHVSVIWSEHAVDFHWETILSKFNDVHIALYPFLPADASLPMLFRTKLFAKKPADGRVPVPFAPLADGMLVLGHTLPTLLAATAVFAHLDHRVHSDGYVMPYLSRLQLIHDITARYAVAPSEAPESVEPDPSWPVASDDSAGSLLPPFSASSSPPLMIEDPTTADHDEGGEGGAGDSSGWFAFTSRQLALCVEDKALVRFAFSDHLVTSSDQRGLVAHLQRVSAVSLRGHRLGMLPEDLGLCASMASLGLAYGPLVRVPPVVMELTQLRVLDLACNRLESVEPALLRALPLLEVLRLQYNRIEALAPECLPRLAALRLCDLTGNPVLAPAARAEWPRRVEWRVPSLRALASDVLRSRRVKVPAHARARLMEPSAACSACGRPLAAPLLRASSWRLVPGSKVALALRAVACSNECARNYLLLPLACPSELLSVLNLAEPYSFEDPLDSPASFS